MVKYNLKKALLMQLILLVSFSSCQKDSVTPPPTLISFGPTTVKHGESIKFIGTGLDQIAEIVMPVGVHVPSSSFTTHTSSMIELVVPQASTVGYVKLKTTKGDSLVSKTVFGAAYSIAVRSFTPATAKPGTNLTINGDFLNYVKQVTFSQKHVVTQFVSQSLHQLVVTVPMTAQTGGISLTDLATTPQLVDQDTLNNDLVLSVTLPVATAFAPATGVEQTSNLTINGTDLDLVTEIDFPGPTNTIKVVAPFVTQSANQIVVTVPASAVSGQLSMLVPSGVKVKTPSLTVLEPTITSIPVGRDASQVTISGTNLNLVSSILFPDGGAGTAVPSTSFTTSNDGTAITVTIPASAIPGSLQLTTKHNFSVTVPGFKITLPVASSYSATSPGAATTITGTDLDLVKSVIFPDGTIVLSSAFNSQSPTSINVTVPVTVTSGALIFTIDNGYQVAQPAFGACSTYFAGGSVLYSFNSDLQGWFADTQYSSFSGATSLTAVNSSSIFHSCVGSAQMVIPFASADAGASDYSSGGKTAEIEINPSSLSFTGKSKVHFWVKLANPSNANNVQIYIQLSPSNGWSNAHYETWYYAVYNTLPDGGKLNDGNWHELVADLSQTLAWDGGHTPIDPTYLNQALQIGVQVVAGYGTTGQVTLYLDDIWVE